MNTQNIHKNLLKVIWCDKRREIRRKR